MKGTDSFKKAIGQHLEQQASEDPLFAETLTKPNKNIDDCITYILNQVKNSGCAGFEDSEIYGMAVHYYDEDDLQPGSPINANVVVNHVVQLTADEIAKAKQAAFDKILQDEKDRLKKKSAPAKPQPALEASTTGQQSLF